MRNNVFTFKRLWYQLKRDFISYWTIFLLFYISILVLYILKIMYDVIRYNEFAIPINFQKIAYTGLLFISMIVLAAISFRDFRNKLTTQAYLLIPSSALEKFLSMWILVLPFHIIVFTAVFYLITIILGGLSVLFGQEFYLFNAFKIENFTPANYNGLRILSLQAIYFAGAATFRKDAWLKTLLVMTLVSFAYFIIVLATGFLFVKVLGYELVDNINIFDRSTFHTRVLNIITPITFWLIAFFKIQEKQV